MQEKRGHSGRKGQSMHIDIGMVIFFIILIYIFASIVLYITSDKAEVYEVRMGTLSDNATYRGIALREEKIVESRFSGYVNYYNKETDHVAVGGLAYSVDENSEIADYADPNMQAGDYFTAADLENFRQQTRQFTQEFNPDRFYAVYDYKSISSSQAQKISNRAILSGIKDPDSTSIHRVEARDTGAIVYSYDNYSTKSFDKLKVSDFDSSSCRKTQLQNGQKIKKGNPVYRIVTNENWSIAIIVEDEDFINAIKEKEEEQRQLDIEEKDWEKLEVDVRFLKNNYVSRAKVTGREDKDGTYFVNLEFSNSMETFCGERFVDIEILSNEKKGLKVPNSAITTGEFFLVPKDYIFEGSNGHMGVLLHVYTGSGSSTQGTRFIAAVPYSETSTEYYLDNSVLRDGEILQAPNSNEQFTLGKKETLVGVYYMNKGYPDFRQVDVTMKNDEYSIVTSNVLYGLQEYDYIVLHADTVQFNDY